MTDKQVLDPFTYKFDEQDFNAFIAHWLNEDHPNFVAYVKGMKLFLEYLESRDD